MQVFPPFLGQTWVPLPQDFEHSPNFVQFDHRQSVKLQICIPSSLDNLGSYQAIACWKQWFKLDIPVLGDGFSIEIVVGEDDSGNNILN